MQWTASPLYPAFDAPETIHEYDETVYAFSEIPG